MKTGIFFLSIILFPYFAYADFSPPSTQNVNIISGAPTPAPLQNVNLTQVSGSSVSLGQKTNSTSIPVSEASDNLDRTVISSILDNTTNQDIEISTVGMGSMTIYSGGSWTLPGEVNFQGTYDSSASLLSTDWYSLNCENASLGDGNFYNGIFQNAIYKCDSTGMQKFRVWSPAGANPNATMIVALEATPASSLITGLIGETAIFPVFGSTFAVTQSTSPWLTSRNWNLTTADQVLTIPASGSTWPISAVSLPTHGVTQSTSPWVVSGSGNFITIPATGSTWPISAMSLPTHGVTQSTSPWIVSGSGNFITIPATGSTWAVTQSTSPWVISSSGGNFAVTQNTSPWVVSGSGNFITIPANNSTWPVSFTNQSINLNQVNGNAVATGISASGIGTQQVSISTDSSISLGTSTNKTMKMLAGSSVTATSTGGQIILSYTTTSGKTFYMNYLSMEGRLSVLSSTASVLGTIYLVPPVGSSIAHTFINPTTEAEDRVIYTFPEPYSSSSGSIMKVLADPAASTSMIWKANFGGYEK